MQNCNRIHRPRPYPNIYLNPQLSLLCRYLFSCLLLLALLLSGLLLPNLKAQAQDPNASTSQTTDPATQDGDDATPANVGPVRMVRFKLVTGAVTWRADSGIDWSPASINLPIRQGAQVYVPTGARAEVQFDDGSMMHLGGGALITFHNLYSDADGEFTQLTLKDGIVSFRLRNKFSVYQVDTPLASVKAVGPARIRIGVRDIVEVGVRYGSATVEGQQDKATIKAKGFLTIRDTTTPYTVTALPPDDTWEKWIDKRYQANSPNEAMSKQDLPPDIYLIEPDLDAYGTWNTDPTYGAVWCPHVDGNWRPYAAGSWVWVDPFGWTWVSTETWGWAPYHYGSWVHIGVGWGWVPGPAHQYWSPGVVSFFVDGGSIAWVPLCPEEIRYPPTFAIGFHGGDWSLFFSIGGCGVYYPGPNHICVARRWNTGYINRRLFLTDINHNAAHFAFVANHNGFVSNGSWVPRNAGFGGGSIASSKEFGTGHNYAPVPGNNLAAFQRGRLVGAPENGKPPSAGPANVKPTLTSLTPARSFAHVTVPANVASRPTYRAPVSQRIALNAPTRTGGGTTRPGAGTTPGTARPPVARPQPGSTEDAVIRARSSVGLPQRARSDNGQVVGSGTVAPPVPARNDNPAPRVNTPPPPNYTVREAPQRSQPRPSSGGGGGNRGGGGGGGGGGRGGKRG
jgi:hypothetical protein